jgi:hypothetical protein
MGIWIATLGLRPRTRSGILREVLLALTLFPGLTLLTLIPLRMWQIGHRGMFLLELGVWLAWVALAGWGMHRMLRGRGRVLRATVLGLALITLPINGRLDLFSWLPKKPGPVTLHARRVVFREWGGEGIRLTYRSTWGVRIAPFPWTAQPVVVPGMDMDTMYLLDVPDTLVLTPVERPASPRNVAFPPLDPGVDTVSFFIQQGDTLRWRIGVPMEIHLPTQGVRLTPWRHSLDLPEETGDTLRAVLYLPVPREFLLSPVTVILSPEGT